jgi:hypothetical protein
LVKVAVTERSWLIVSVHVPVPVQAPLQPMKVEPGAGVAVSTTLVPAMYASAQSPGQEIPAGELVTVPASSPPMPTDSVWVVTFWKLAMTVWLEFMISVQEAVPEQAPPQPANVEPDAGVAVSAIAFPSEIIPLQGELQANELVPALT